MSRNVVRKFYRLARVVNDLDTLASGNPRRIRRRAKNILLNRVLGRLGFWRFLYR